MTTKEKADKAKVNPGEYRALNIDLNSKFATVATNQTDALIHARRQGIIC